jgi:NAD(P)-dependent dehydrogenase (short-subunit alcohol dehydrogenase family)
MNLNKFNLENKYSLITGAGGLLGEQHARALLEIKSNIILTDINKKKINNLYKTLKKDYPYSKILNLYMNVSSEKSVKMTFLKLKKKNIFVDILINNAAIDYKINSGNIFKKKSRIENLLLSNLKKELEVSLIGTVLCIKYFGSAMALKNKGGVILNIGSDLSKISPNQNIYFNKKISFSEQQVKPITYSIAKHGIIGITKYISTYWATNNVRCNCLSPGAVFDYQSKPFIKKITKLIPMNRLANKNEYKSAVQFLCSDASKYMTGQNIIIDGGRTVW